MSRKLRSKRLRALLWYAADGRCAKCGRELPEHWHADHVIPFVRSGRTNVHEMQALCPECNLRKGSAMLWEKDEGKKLRQHQIDMLQVCREIAAAGMNQYINEIDVFVTPGGGKSTIPIIAAAELIAAGYADKICWIVPRVSLQEQAELQFLDRWFRRVFKHEYKVRSSTNDVDPSRGTCGFVTTYSALAADAAGTVRREFDRYRYILVSDEIHHVAIDSQWHQALQPLVDRARLFIPMSGSLYRGDGQKIAFLRYREIPGGEQIDMRPTECIRVIQYDRVAALRERAIIPIQVTFQDCKAEWIDRAGAPRVIGSFDEVTDDSSDALFTALRTSFAFQMIDKSRSTFQRIQTDSFQKQDPLRRP
jgi:hypothetical protein